MPRASRVATAAIASSIALCASWVAPRPAPAQTPPVRVQVVGIDGELRRNVLASLTIRKRSERKGQSETGIRQLHAKAEDEIRRALEPYGYYQPLIQAELTTDGRPWVARYTVQPG